MINDDITACSSKQLPVDKDICDWLVAIIHTELAEAENKVLHAHPLCLLDANPVV